MIRQVYYCHRNLFTSNCLCDTLRSAATRCKTSKNRLKTRRLYSHGGSIPPPGTTLTLANPMDCAVLIPPFRFAPFLPLEGWCMLGVVTPATSCDFRICDSDSDPGNHRPPV